MSLSMFSSTTSTTHLGESINYTHHAWEIMSDVEWMYLFSTGEACWVLTVPARREEQTKRGWAQAWSEPDKDPKQSVEFGLINQLFIQTGTFPALAGARSRCPYGSWQSCLELLLSMLMPGCPWQWLWAMLCASVGVTQLQPPAHSGSLLAPAPSLPPCWARTACCPWVALSCQLEMVLNEAVVRHSLLGSSSLRLLQLPVVSTLIRKENSFPQSGPQPTVHTCLFPWQLVFLLLMAQSPVKSVS